MDEFEDTVRRMAELGGKKGPVHPWWATARALVAVLESGNEEAIGVARATWNKEVGNK